MMMETERPPLLFPEPTMVEKEKKSFFPASLHRPSVSRQAERLVPQFSRLVRAFDQRAVELKDNPAGIAPEMALVFETVGSTANFFSAVSRIDGLEWLAEYAEYDMEPDADFHFVGNSDKSMTGKVYCVMSDRKALDELLSCWKRYVEDEGYKFDRGYASLKDLFLSLREVRTWSAKDRFEDTGVIEQWKDDLELRRGSLIPFEIELFYRSSEEAQRAATSIVRERIEEAGGQITDICIMDEIRYHGIAAKLPPERIEELVNSELDCIELAKTEQIMFFRPSSQALLSFEDSREDGFVGSVASGEHLPVGNPVIGLLDGVPVENHQLLRNRIVLDDPDEFGSLSPVDGRKHGTQMASLVIHGDLDDPHATCLSRPLYVRPIMTPAFMTESFPEGRLIVDLIHCAVVRMFDGVDDEPASAPEVCVVNLSIGDSQRQYLNSVSPLARLLDWLSFRYRVLFVISAGNTHSYLQFDASSTDGLQHLDSVERTKVVIDGAMKNRRNLRLFSPSESVNAITVGSLYDDWSTLPDRDDIFTLVEDGIPAPYSAVGPGVNRSIKPELYLPGGRLMVQNISSDGKPHYAQQLMSGPGCRTAYPTRNQPASGEGYSIGTSNSAALLSHAAGELYEMLDDVFLRAGERGVPRKYAAVLIKGALAHGATWDTLERARAEYYQVGRSKADQWIGYGVPDFSKVISCSPGRVTAIGFGELSSDNAHEYRLPLPVDLHTRGIRRRVTATLAYLTPIACGRQEYGKARLWFDLCRDNYIAPNRVNADWRAVQRGTLQHEVFEGSGAIAWGDEDEVQFRVNCRQSSTTGKIGGAVPYAFLVTVELAETVGDVYSKVENRLRQQVPLEITH